MMETVENQEKLEVMQLNDRQASRQQRRSCRRRGRNG
jgi:hypothetical protein